MDSARGDIVDGRIKLRHLVCFLEVARLKSVVRAASVLGLSQPAASKTIHELEVVLGVELFDRSRRSMLLTTFGEVFQRYAAASVTALKQGMQSVTQAEAGAVVTLTVGALPTVSARILPAAAAHFSALGSGMRLRIVTGPNAHLMSQLRLGDVDLVIGRMAEPDAMRGFVFEHLYSEQIALAVRPGHPLLQAQPFDIAAVARFQTLVPPRGSIIRPAVDRFLVAHAIALPENFIETVSDAFARRYTRMSDAIWIISEGVVIEDIADGLLARLPADTSDTSGPVGLTTRIDAAPSMALAVFAQSVRAVVGSRLAGEQADPTGALDGTPWP